MRLPRTDRLCFVGIGGTSTATAHQRDYSSQDLTGYIAQDTNSKYTFIQTDYIKYDIGLDGTIKIGPTTYTVASSYRYAGCNGSNSLHLVVVNRETPSVLIANNTYCTGQSDSDISHFIQDLQGVLGHEEQLVFFASNGHPIPANWSFGTDGDPRIVPLARIMRQFGGYWETMVYLTPNDTYSLVGATAPLAGTPGAQKRAREASSVYLDHPKGELHGVLGRGRRGNWYQPINANFSGLANLDFYQILSQSSTSFPHPANAAKLQAFNQISTALCGASCNIRNIYPDTNVSIASLLGQLEELRDGNNDDCSLLNNQSIPYCIVKQQLHTELGYVADIRNFNANLQTLWLASGSISISELLSAYNDIQAQINAPGQAQAPDITDPLVSFFLSLASFIPEVGPAFGLADTAFSLATSLTTDLSGNPIPTLYTTVSNLHQQAADNFTAQANTIGTQFDLIYQDWGRIQALGTALQNAQQPASPWFWNGSTTTSQILQAMSPAIKASYYRSLMSAAFAIGSYLPNSWQDSPTFGWGTYPLYQQPSVYVVWNPGSGPNYYNPFQAPSVPPYTYPSDANNPYTSNPGTQTILGDGSWLGISNQSDSNVMWSYWIPFGITPNLFTPQS